MSALTQSYMSLGELAVCEDVLDSHREYALDLLSSVEKIHYWHNANHCPKVQQGRTCIVCELCSADGLMGATKHALVSYDDTVKQLHGVRASLARKSVSPHGTPNRETLLKSSLAKTVFVHIIATGDTLRLERAIWQARLQSRVDNFSSAESLPHWDVGLSSHPGPNIIGSETMSDSMFIVFRRCLLADCPREANRARIGAMSNTFVRSARESLATLKYAPSPLSSSDEHTSQVATNLSEGTYGNEVTLPVTKPDHQSIDEANTNTRSQLLRTCYNRDTLNATGAPETMVASRKHERSRRATLSSQIEGPIVDPRVSCLRAQIVRYDDAYQTFMSWCRGWATKLEKNMAGPTHTKVTKDIGRSTLTLVPKPAELGKPICMISQTGRRIILNNTDMTAQSQRFESEQEELKDLWLAAQKKYTKRRKRQPVRV